jgi:hypothetical protein
MKNPDPGERGSVQSRKWSTKLEQRQISQSDSRKRTQDNRRVICLIHAVVFHNASSVADHVLAVLGIVDLSALFDDGIVQESFRTVSGDNGSTVVHEGRESGIFVVGIIS